MTFEIMWSLIVYPREAQIELSDLKQKHFDFALGHGLGTSLARGF